MKKRNYTLKLTFIIGIIVFFSSCNNMKIGYLQTENASFAPDELIISHTIDKESIRYKNQAPWTSLRIQGVAGTNPINYKFERVKSDNAKQEEIFTKAVEASEILVSGGIIRVYQSAVEKLPNGKYVISLQIYNEGYSNILEDVFTIIITD